MRPRPHSVARGLTAAAAVTLLTGAGIAVAAAQASAAAGCRVTYSVNQWSTGFTANLAVTNLGDPISGGWTLAWDFAGNQRVTQGWNGTFTQSGRHVSVAAPSYANSLATNATATLGFNADYSGTNTAPATFTLNGTQCTGTVPTDPSTPPPSDPTTPPPPGTKVDNPYAGARGYVNPEWKAKADAEPGGNRVSNNPTAVWLDRIAAIEGTADSSSNGAMGLRDHLDAAVAQGAGYVQFVIYNLPGRDCSALASNGELGVDDLPRYKAEYIDPIAAIQADPKYRNLRIINVVEIDSLPNLVTNTNVATCATMKSNGGYVQGIGYALNKLGAIPNVYNYVDAAHHGWIGWDTNFGPTADIMLEAARASGNVRNVHGFITNTANYSALTEPYFTITTTVNGTSVRQAKWVDWNYYVDELTFAQAFRQKLVSIGFDPGIGMLIDTSRNGWGGPDRPTAASTSTDVNTFVNQSRIDRRIHAGNWCNQDGAGLGERPKAAPAAGIDAYVWVKPPGESDGSSTLIPNDEGKGFDRMCDPTYTGNERNGNNPSGALPNAPISGAWFSAQFRQLMANAYPPLS
ncbi:glycoside hydrolase family 6 protein [Actinoplanes sp. NPDC049548]|uniref:glycoside hydrolase family 6 protein n=1 Tax=Actinoplanes sp. NPDC049548 TaxID=3155152 RepID=UPI003433C570